MHIRQIQYLPAYASARMVRYTPLIPKLLPRRLMLGAASVRSPDDYIYVEYNPRDRNWGDALNEFLVPALTGRRVLSSRFVLRPSGARKFAVLGSVLGLGHMRGAIIWGAGFLGPSSVLRGRPRYVAAVRGPLTAAMLRTQGVELPDDLAYGDPAILMPLLHRPQVEARHVLGIIPHYADTSAAVPEDLQRSDDVLTIDIEAGVHTVVEQLLSCEAIASSSLHGLIAADAYGLPRVWLPRAQQVDGGEFKFLDYARGVGLADHPTTPYAGPMEAKELIRHATHHPIPAQAIDDLIGSCPLPPAMAGHGIRQILGRS